MKKLSLWCRPPVVALQDAIWAWGKYDKEAMAKFVNDFNPDIVFCPRMVNPKLIRLERLVRTMTKAPFVAFTAVTAPLFCGYPHISFRIHARMAWKSIRRILR